MTIAQASPLPAHIFRAYDIRGIVGDALTPDIVRRIGGAIGAEAHRRGARTLVVGRDGRNSGAELRTALVEGLRESGRDVVDVGRVPSPVLYFATEHLETGSGVMVTGSHNPAAYNGLKIVLAGDTLHGDAIQNLRRRIEVDDLDSGRDARGRGCLRDIEIVGDYIRRVCTEIPAVPARRARKIVIDCGNGVAGDVAPRLFRALGHDVVALYCEIDGDFPNHHPDPSVPENLRDLVASVRENEADLGLAFDGDGDRLGVVDGEGNIIWPDRQMMLFASDVLASRPGAEIVFDVKCSGLLAEHIASLGGRPVMTKTGHSFIKAKLRETGAPLAGEMSGHIFFADRWYGFDDAIYSAARLVQILVGLGEPSAQIFARFPAAKSTPELRVRVGEGEQVRLVDALLAGDRFPGARKTTIDGLRVDWSDGWGLARASNTEPCLVVRFEGVDDDALTRIMEEFRQALLSVDDSLELPF
ncbi:MAG: phosphomannomutase/phosphoglucomutase [Chromatiales bacterium]|nr:phosphomannomutase/phosphoglucomutase [Chromatiales bacterium]